MEKTHELILELIRQDPKITAARLGEKTRCGVAYNLEKSNAEGSIERIGADKGVYGALTLDDGDVKKLLSRPGG